MDSALNVVRASVHRDSVLRHENQRVVLCSISAMVVAFVMLAGCSTQQDSQANNSQVVARVNGTEITVHQVDYELAKRGLAEGVDRNAAAEQILDELVNRELFVQKARAAKLDRTPEMVLALERARAQVLSEAYLNAIWAIKPPPSTDDVAKYYNAHPELFAARRVYRFKQLALADATPVATIEPVLKTAKTLDDVEKTLSASKLAYKAEEGVIAAEDLPFEFLLQAQQMKPGQLSYARFGGTLNVVQIVDSAPAPVSQEQAAPLIERYLVNDSHGAAISSEVARLRQVAKIDVLRHFNVEPNTAAMAATTTAKAP